MENKWTRNQKILLVGLILTFIGLVINTVFLITTSNKTNSLNLDLNEFKGKAGEIDQLKTMNITVYGKICLTQNCSSYIYNNGTGVIIVGSTSELSLE